MHILLHGGLLGIIMKDGMDISRKVETLKTLKTFQVWKKRWVVVRRPYVFIYRDERDLCERGLINLAQARTEYSIEQQNIVRNPAKATKPLLSSSGFPTQAIQPCVLCTRSPCTEAASPLKPSHPAPPHRVEPDCPPGRVFFLFLFEAVFLLPPLPLLD